MDLISRIRASRDRILDQWFTHTINTYPPETAKVLGKSGNRFDNPVGVATMDSLQQTLDLMFQPSFEAEDIGNALDSVIRIRAVQSFSASRAVGFVFFLKSIIRTELNGDTDPALEDRIDRTALAAFDRFMKCREDIYLLKATEAKRRIHRAFERAGLVEELKESDLLDSPKS